MITIINPYYPIDDSVTDDAELWTNEQIVEYLEPGDFAAERHSVVLRRGTQAQMFSSNLRDYEIVFTTDTNEVYLFNGTGKKLVGACVTGTHDERPSAVVPGKLYFETDTFTLFLTSGDAWVQLTYSPADISAHINAASPHSKHATLNASNTVVENPASATTTPTVNSIPLSRSDSPTISGAWLNEVDCGALA
jgi:hypothetical protein